ncbi:substrate-binding domain-containing protein [Planococcus shenhongbingii]|uniref:Substrate-binding domain-containing protein n=1 Tax=Planococcus shenhongbingii TaxID=3058398 RepID=A0ABT8NEL9_9BACL|nr:MULTISPECIES: substrate-binding domain-containing protein [unclassified Planococcus (in: firmicutes)]MDN7246154.1 substrate-binding domain-containing protein [Planococcus sp. N017]WKA59161.1 substrate-binding domain-containing protein [Planococcus sp. N016]
MARNVTIAQVAEQAKVSKSTVSQFLNKRYEYMSESTRQRIEAAIEELNYHPNIIARSLKQKSTYTVGVIVANILHSFSTQILRAIENNFNDNGFHIIICNADDEPEKERNYIEMLLAKQVDGLIIFPTGGNLDLYEQMKQRNFPVVFMDRKIDGLEIDTVMLDNHQAAKLAVDAFVESDYNQISIITTSIIRNTSPRVERIEGYKLALEEHGLPVRPEYIRTADAEQIQGVLKELFALQEPPEAILAGNDIVLIEVLKYMKDHQLKIPKDVAVIGIDEVSFASFYSPPLTVVTQPTIEMANKATELLLAQINSKNKTARTAIHRLHPSLIKRSSC